MCDGALFTPRWLARGGVTESSHLGCFVMALCVVAAVTSAQVNRTYIEVTERMKRDPNALRACLLAGLLTTLNEMDQKLEEIQKSLDAVRGG
jgi:hypothetical protein